MDSLSSPPYILLAEDDEVCGRILEASCQKSGWTYDLVKDGKAALKAAKLGDYDVIVTDFKMPGLDGLELIRSVRANKPGQAFIVVSSACTTEDTLDLLRAGAVDFLAKPVDLTRLQSSVIRVTQEVRALHHADSIYRFVTEEDTTLELTSEQLASNQGTLPILRKLFKAGRLGISLKLRLELALQEALTNSLDHGNLELDSKWREDFDKEGIDKYSLMRKQRLSDPKYAQRKITIRTMFAKNTLKISIADQGSGFDLNQKAAAPSPIDPLCFGRGMTIIKGIVDQVSYSNSGREITLIKFLTDVSV